MNETITPTRPTRPTRRAQLFGELTDIDRQILKLEQAKESIGTMTLSFPAVLYFDHGDSNKDVIIHHDEVIAWIDYNIDGYVERKTAIQRELAKPTKIREMV